MYNNRIAKWAAGAMLGLTLVLSGTITAAPQAAHAAQASGTADNIIATGKQYLGVPYKFGAKTGRTGSFDCSSFTQFIFRQNGVSIPRSSKQQSTAGTFVPRDQLQPGDLVFFYSPIHHVGVYIGNGQIMHAVNSKGVSIADLNSSFWSRNYTTARRVLSGAAPAAATPVPPVTAQPAKSAAQRSKPSTQLTANPGWLSYGWYDLYAGGKY